MSLKLNHALDDKIQIMFGDKFLCDYVYVSQVDPFESRKPRFCPMYTLAGDEVTVFRPHDHLWHVGLSMTWTYINDQNFWGGNTYIHGEGYKPLDNVGESRHISWNNILREENAAYLDHNIHWISSRDEHWMTERRKLDIQIHDAEAGVWSIGWDMTFENVSGITLNLGSPLTHGRPLAGYGGLFWRGPRSFRDGDIISSGGYEGEDIVTHQNEWVAFIGKHDTTINTSTLIFLDNPENMRYPTKWWGRVTPYGCISSSFAYDEEYEFEPDTSLALKYRVFICNGGLDTEAVKRIIA